MLPIGFKVGGGYVGISKNMDMKKYDLALFLSEKPASAAGVFTKNLVKAAPVNISITRLQKKSSLFYGIVANSGCANACTGHQGNVDAEYICTSVENSLNLQKGTILCASTGIIGKPININDKFLPKNINYIINNSMGTSAKNEDDAILGIMTTDTFIKKVSKQIFFDNKKVTIWGCVKGAGMIHPNLSSSKHATMLAFILTDIQVDNKVLQKILENSLEDSFHSISIDGDTSTNDSIIVLANGMSDVTVSSNRDLYKFAEAFNEIMIELAKLVVKDGEGATKFIEIEIKNLKTKNDAKKIASTIATSPLVKTALFGSDLNWGRIIAAIGRSGVSFNLNKIDLYIANIKILNNGEVIKFPIKTVKESLCRKTIKLIIDFNDGDKSTKYYTCDLSYNYVKINSEYN
ncbi:MAG: bifunctional glutamate N-acetyltransferase/amino-acid acetyltransferase ArgJ [Endomicrobium sp.]|nr:bifunctional glutamate N-acetyltransferase/amino-acid acetyltransferase ArgJ [Endomicrobium sp.]